MNKYIEKLEDYVSGIRELQGQSLPIGVIILDGSKEQKQEVFEYLRNKEMEIVELNMHPDLILWKIFNSLSSGKSIALDVNGDIPIKILDELKNMHLFKRMDIMISGETERKILNPIPQGTFVIFILDEENYKKAMLGEISSSFCNLKYI